MFKRLKRIEAFLYSKEYNPSQLVSNIENNEDEENENENENIDNNENMENNQNDNIEDKKNEKEKGNEKEEDKIMINIDNLDFGIIKKEEEFMEVEEYEAEESEDSEEEILLTKNRKKIDKSKNNQDGIELIEFNHDENESEKEKLLIDNKEDFEEKSEEIIQNLDKGEEKEVIKGTVIINLLKEINLKVKKGELIGIIGEIGSGKTCLFNAILNNLDILNNKLNKKIILNGKIAYAPQKPWILNDTVRNNIIFHKIYDEQKYNKIVNICQLEQDFELFKSGDLTQLSDKGNKINH